MARESTTPNNALASAGARTVATLAAIRPGTFVKRLVSWVFLWVATLFLIYSNWRTPSLISIGLLALLGQWEFYRAQEEKGHKVFKQSGLFCGALIFFVTWFFLIHRPACAPFQSACRILRPRTRPSRGDGMSNFLLQNPLLILAGGGILALLLLGLALKGTGSGKLGRRTERLHRRLHAVSTTVAGDVKLLRDVVDRRVIDRIFLYLMPQPDMLRQRLQRTGRQIGLGTYGAASLVAVLVSGGAMLSFGLSAILALPGGLLVGLWLPHMVIGYLAKRRALRFTLLFPEAIGLMVRGVKSGLPITQSFQIVGAEIPDPVGLEFRHLTDQIRLGQSIDQALWDAARRVATPEMQFLVVTLSIQRETGGNLAETLENLDSILRRRRQMKLKIRAMSSEARASAMIIGALPFLMGALLSVVDPDYIVPLLEKPLGHTLLFGASISMSFGIFVMSRMIKFEI